MYRLVRSFKWSININYVFLLAGRWKRFTQQEESAVLHSEGYELSAGHSADSEDQDGSVQWQERGSHLYEGSKQLWRRSHHGQSLSRSLNAINDLSWYLIQLASFTKSCGPSGVGGGTTLNYPSSTLQHSWYKWCGNHTWEVTITTRNFFNL